MIIDKKSLGIYIHIPFCIKKCLYCDFLSFSSDEKTRNRYVQALMKEIEYTAFRYTDYEVNTIFIGGGTPSILFARNMEEILCKLRESFTVTSDAEITVEVNPGTVTKDKLVSYFSAGVNRLSIGLQSAKDEELERLGRIHSYAEFIDTYKLAVAVGFENISVDLIFALPEQSKEEWNETLEAVAGLCPKPTHMSVYSLIIEEGTPFHDVFGTECKALPTEDEERNMYAAACRFLESKGYQQYEISNFSQEGFKSRHNSCYWKRDFYVGLGLGASSMVHNLRWKNEEDLDEYIKILEENNPIATEEILCKINGKYTSLTLQEQMEEFMFLGLRMTKGVSGNVFKRTFKRSLEDIYGVQLKALMQDKLLIRETVENDILYRLTAYGIDVSNYVFARFLQEDE